MHLSARRLLSRPPIRLWDWLISERFRPARSSRKGTAKLDLMTLETREVPSAVMYNRDFDPATSATLATGVSATWSNTVKKSTPNGNSFLGDFGNQTVTLTLAGLPAHGALTVEFDLYLIRSWDGNDGAYGADNWSFAAGGTTFVDGTFRVPRPLTSNTGFTQTYSKDTPLGTGGSFESGKDAASLYTLGYTFNNGTLQPLDAVYRFQFPVTHTGSSITLSFAASGLQAMTDESWGLDNVKVTTGRPPSSVGDSYETTMGRPLSVPAPGVLANDSDPDGDAITASLTLPPANGSVSLASNGSFIYTPSPGFVGTDTFKYKAYDGANYGNEATVNVAVTPQVVTIQAATPTTEEAGTSPNGDFVVVRTGSTAHDLTVTLTTPGGTATSGADYVALPTTVVIPAGQSSVHISVAPINDSRTEGNETVVLGVAAGTYYTMGSQTAATVTIEDDEFRNAILMFIYAQSCSCGCPCPPNILAALEKNAQAVVTAARGVASQFSMFPVRYADGTVKLTSYDLSSEGVGAIWGQTRSWSNGAGYATDQANGSGWVVSQAPRIIQVDGLNTLGMIVDGQTALFFDLVGGSYVPKFGGSEKLAYSSGTDKFTLTTAGGDALTFGGFSTSLPQFRRGQFESLTTSGGNTTAVAAWTGQGNIAEVRSTVGGVTDSYVSMYLDSGVNVGLLASVALRRSLDGGTTWNAVRSVDYAYYNGVEAHGNAGDLKTAIIKDATGSAVSTDYYRYYTTESGGYQHGLKYAVLGASYDRLKSDAGGTDAAAQSVSDATASVFADHYFEYDSTGRMTAEVASGAGCSVCSAGQGTFTNAYTTSTNADGPNSWKTKTVETLPDGNQNIVYTNASGDVMLKAFRNVTTDEQWVTYYQFDANSRVVMTADPSAVTGYDDSYADLVNIISGNAQYVSDTSGVVRISTYGSSTTATSSSPGSVLGYLASTAIRRGETGTNVPQQSITYYSNTAGGSTVYVVAADTVYRNDDGTGAITTSYATTYFSGSNAVQSQTMYLPMVATGQHGSGIASTSTVVYDAKGRPAWTKDAAGVLGYMAYDSKTGAVVKMIADVNTSNTSDFANLPSGWTTPSGAGQHLVSTSEVDSLGRTTKAVDPLGRITYTVYNEVNREVRVYAGWNTSTLTPTGPIAVSRENRALGYTETFLLDATPTVDGSGRPTGLETVTTSAIRSLNRTLVNSAGQQVGMDAYTTLSGAGYSTASAALGASGTNYLRTRQDYDMHGLPNRVIAPDGTIMRTVYDGLGRPVSEWMGNNDTPSSSYWSPSNPAGMVKVRQYEYDHGGIGDGLLTKMTEFPGGAVEPVVTLFEYDWRGRNVAMKEGSQEAESRDVNRPLTVHDYDNLNRIVRTRVYDGDQQSLLPPTWGGVRLGGSGSDFSGKPSVDEMGNVYVPGTFEGTVDFDTVSGTVTLDSSNGAVFLAKYSPAGQLLWIRQGGGADATGAGVTADEIGNVYVSGTFATAADFGSTTLTSASGTDAFVWKLDSDGTTQWAVQAGGVGDVSAFGVSSDGSIYVAGIFSSASADFGTTTLTPVGGSDIYLWKLDDSGTTVYAYRAGGSGDDTVTDVDIEGSEVTITGGFSSTADFYGVSLVSAGGIDAYAWRIGEFGGTEWAHRAGGSGEDIATGVWRSTVTGTFSSTADFGPVVLTSNGGKDTFVWSLETNEGGETKWAVGGGGTGDEIGGDLVIDTAGNILVFGSFDTTALFGGTSLTPADGTDIFSWKMDSSGASILVTHSAGMGNESVSGVTTQNRTDIYVSGVFDGAIICGDVEITTVGGTDAFLWHAGTPLRGETRYSYDDRGSLYQTRSYRVDQTIGTLTPNPDNTRFWYDNRGQLVKTEAPNGLVQKYAYDSLGRLSANFTTDGGGDTSFADALTVTGDTVFAQGEYTYDEAGQLILMIDRERNDGATTTGVLSASNARTTYSGSYYDLLGRTTVSVDVGTNGGTAWTRPTSAPASSDTTHVTTFAYGSNGLVSGVTAADGVTDTTTYDLLGRTLTQTAASGTSVAFVTTNAYDSGGRLFSVTSPGNRTTQYGYDSFGRLDTVIERAGTAFARTTKSVYDNIGRTVTVTEGYGSSLAVTTAMTYDPVNRMVSTTEASGTSLARTTSTTYDVFGRTLTSHDFNFERTSYNYNDPDRKVVTIDALGHAWTSEYDNAGNMVASTDPLGNTTTTAFDLRSRAVSTTTPLLHTTLYRYFVGGDRDETEDALGHTTAVEFDSFNRVASQFDALANETQFSYDRVNRTTSMTDPRGYQTNFDYDALGRNTTTTEAVGTGIERTTTNAYNTAGDLESFTDPMGRVTQYGYDSAGRATSVTAAYGTSIALTTTTAYDLLDRTVSVTAPGSRITGYNYDRLGQLTAAVESVGTSLERTTNYGYDAAGNMTSMTDAVGTVSEYGYDALNRNISTTEAVGTVIERATSMAFDPAGRMTSTTDARGNSTTYGYDADGRRTSVTNALSQTTSFAFDAADNMTSMTDALTHTTAYAYDAANRLITVTSPLLNATNYGYDANGNRTSMTDARGNTTHYGFDALNRNTTVTNALSQTTTTAYNANDEVTSVTNARGAVMSFDFDALGRLTGTTDPLTHTTARSYDPTTGDMSRTTDGVGYHTDYTYDALGRVSTVTSPRGGVTTTLYDALDRVVSVTDPVGSLRSWGYDELGRVTGQTDANGDNTQFQYDANDNRIALMDASSNSTQFQYDVLNRLVIETDPLYKTSTSAYDAAGNLESHTDRLGRTIVYGYDADDRRISEEWLDALAVTVQTQTYSYDEVGNLLTATDPDGDYTMTYDALNRVATTVQPFGFEQEFTYDAAGNRIRVEDNKNATVESTFDLANRLTSRNLDQGPITSTNFTYNARNELVLTENYYGGFSTSTSYTYNADGQKTRILTQDASATTVADFNYVYDLAGRLTEKTENSTTSTYANDAEGQVTDDNGTSLSYDATGNRTGGTTIGANNRLLSDGTWTYSYDDAGFSVSKTDGTVTWNYAYDHRGQLTSATDGTITVQYVYDAFGNRILRSDGTATEKFAYDGWNPAHPSPVGNENFEAVADLDALGTVTMRRMYGEGFDDLLARMDTSGTPGFYVTDIVGSVRQVLDNTGSVVAASDFDAFGNLIAGSLSDRYGHTGREWDADLGLQFNRARVYDPVTGRWYAEDEKGFDAGDVNLYRYVGNQATSEVDPSGLDYLKQDGDNVYVITEADDYWNTDKGKILVGTVQTSLDGRKVILPIPGTGYNWEGMADYKTFEILTEKDAYRGTNQWDNQRTHDSILVQLQASASVIVQSPQQDKGILGDLGITISAIQEFGAGGEHVVGLANQNGIPLKAVLPESKIQAVPPKGPPGTKFEPTIGKILVGGASGAAVASGTGFIGGAIAGSFFGPGGTFAGAVTGFLLSGTIGAIEGAYDGCFAKDSTQAGSAAAHNAAVSGLIGGFSGPFINKIVGWIVGKIAPWAANWTLNPTRNIPLSFLKQLENGGSWVMTAEQYAAYVEGRPIAGRAIGQFITSSKEMDRVIAQSKGDPLKIAEALSLKDITANSKLVRIDVREPLKYNARLPDCSMPGANSLFVPGGKTAGGVPEVALDSIPQTAITKTDIIKQ